MAYDWSDTSRRDTITVQMLEPNSFAVRGVLEGVELDGSSITWGYYTDTRTSGTLKVLDSNYIDHSLLRIIHTIPDWGYSRSLGTYVVTNDDCERSNGHWVTTYELHSTLTMIENDYIPYHYTISSGVYTGTVIAAMMKECAKPYKLLGNFVNYRFTEARVYEMGDSLLSDLFDICDRSGNRMTVDGDGNITFNKYTTPHNVSASWSLSLSDPRTNVLDGVSRSSDRLSIPTRAIVTYQHSESKTVDGESVENVTEIYATADATSGETRAKRGYIVAELKQINDLDPATKANAQAEADKLLADVHTSANEYTLSIMYMPMIEGECVQLYLPDGPDAGWHHCLVKEIDLNLADMTMKLALKEV